MKTDEQKELWRWAMAQRSFDISEYLHQMYSTMIALGTVDAFVHDKWVILERQLKICQLEADKLQKAVSNIKFEPIETHEDKA
jgi:hypothetical protein